MGSYKEIRQRRSASPSSSPVLEIGFGGQKQGFGRHRRMDEAHTRDDSPKILDPVVRSRTFTPDQVVDEQIVFAAVIIQLFL